VINCSFTVWIYKDSINVVWSLNGSKIVYTSAVEIVGMAVEEPQAQQVPVQKRRRWRAAETDDRAGNVQYELGIEEHGLLWREEVEVSVVERQRTIVGRLRMKFHQFVEGFVTTVQLAIPILLDMV
jgi:hypothetical protein